MLLYIGIVALKSQSGIFHFIPFQVLSFMYFFHVLFIPYFPWQSILSANEADQWNHWS